MPVLPYSAPLNEMKFALETVYALDETALAVLEEASKFAAGVLSPINQPNDRQPAQHHSDYSVTTPSGMKEAYQQFCENGWNGAGFSTEIGGMGLSRPMSALIAEMWHGAHMSFGLAPMLTQSAIEMLDQFGDDAQKGRYLSKMVSGEWTGTMCMTEPQAGSDIGLVRTKAVKDESGEFYRLTGTKIYITFGEHDLTENIIHTVLARVDGAPEGVKGLSLFIVPKYFSDEPGQQAGARNDVQCVSLEHKMGIHASPTCVMSFGEKDGAIGYLLGEENRGIQTMFAMMNAARYAVGLQGLGVQRYALQLAEAYAAERVQGGGKTIDQHTDIQRSLQSLRGHDLSLRLLAVYYAQLMQEGDSTQAELLTPVLKAHLTDQAILNCSQAMQVFGGMGYIEETGIAQLLRDVRVATIYEGTNSIQGLDLLRRKLPVQDGEAIKTLLSAMWQTANDTANADSAIGKTLAPLLLQAIELLDKTTIHQLQCLNDGTDETLRAAQLAANDYLRLLGLTLQGWLLLKNLPLMENHYTALLPRLQFFFQHDLAETSGLAERIMRSHVGQAHL